jgi:hypothetical protein
MTTHEEMEALYGPAAAHSEYTRGQTVRYWRENAIATGVILWICAPHPVRLRDGRVVDAPLSYVVEAKIGLPDIIYQSDILPD